MTLRNERACATTNSGCAARCVITTSNTVSLPTTTVRRRLEIIRVANKTHVLGTTVCWKLSSIRRGASPFDRFTEIEYIITE